MFQVDSNIAPSTPTQGLTAFVKNLFQKKTHAGVREARSSSAQTPKSIALRLMSRVWGHREKDKHAGITAMLLSLSILSPDRGHFLTLTSTSPASGMGRHHGDAG